MTWRLWWGMGGDTAETFHAKTGQKHRERLPFLLNQDLFCIWRQNPSTSAGWRVVALLKSNINIPPSHAGPVATFRLTGIAASSWCRAPWHWSLPCRAVNPGKQEQPAHEGPDLAPWACLSLGRAHSTHQLPPTTTHCLLNLSSFKTSC